MGAKKQDRGLQKAIEKKKQKIAEDLTFGMKNKKSKKAQTVIKQVSSRFTQGSDGMSAAEAKKLKKLQEKQRQRELRAIFGDQIQAPSKQKTEESAEQILAEVDQDIVDEMEMTLEDIIEKERNKLRGGTQVTEETFARWKEFKKQQKEKEMEVQKALRMKAFAKGAAQLTGRELFEVNSSAFQDDEAAVGKEDYAIDEDLFLDSDEEAPEEEQAEVVEWDPNSWKDVDPPKQKLQEYITKVLKLKNDSYPQYEEIRIQSGGFLFKIHLPHLNKTLEPMQPHQSKKNAQNAAAYMALKYLESLAVEN